jgi:two-component system, cell cycle sensor histidine kinase and response regulator CckA
MKGFSIEQIKGRIGLIVAMVLGAVLCISALGIFSERRDVIAAAERLASGYSRALAEHSESAFSEADTILRETLRELDRKGGLARVDRRELFEQMRGELRDSPQMGTLFIVDPRGMIRINSEEYPSRLIDVSDRQYFQSYRDTPGLGLSFSDPVLSRMVHRRRFNLMRPLNAPGERFKGVICLGFDSHYFKRFFAPHNLGLRGAVSLVRNDGVPIVYERDGDASDPPDFRKSILFREKLPHSPSGVFRVSNHLTRNQPLIVAYQRLARFPLVAVVSFNERDVLAPWRSRAIRQSALTLGLLLVTVMLTRLLFSHLDRLKAAQLTVNGQQAQLSIKAAQIDAAMDPILLIDEQGRLVQFNQALCRITGYGAEELASLRLHDIEPPEYAARIDGNIARLRELGHATFESAYRRRDGGVVAVEVHCRIMQSEGRTLILIMARDITQRRRSEELERNRLETLERIASDAPLEELLECIARFVELQSPGALCSVLLCDETGARLRHGAAPSLPEQYNRAVDGTPIRRGVGSCGSAAFLRRRVVVEEIEAHPYWEGFQPARDAGLRACWSEPILSSSGTLLGTLAIYHREPAAPGEEELLLIESAAHLAGIVIGRVRSDESRRFLEEQLRHSQKMEAVGQLAAGVAHDFNNLLTPIMVYAEMLRRGLAEGSPQLRMVDAVSNAAQKAGDLTQKLLSFGRKQALNISSLDLNEVIRSFSDIMRTTVRESIAVELRLCAAAAQLQGDRGQLEQILLNLLVNAQDAISGNGTISILTGHVVLDDEYARQHPGVKPGRYLQLAVSDDGCGIPEETLSRIYEPFFTTKEVGRGTGLGLATVHGIVKHHDGCIDVKSRPGAGTRFEIYFPAGVAPAAAPGEAGEACLPLGSGGGKTILLAEDNAMIREMAEELLTSFGYLVLAAETPEKALQLACAEGVKIDLLATDVVMPQMTGPELYDRLLQLHPELPVLYISGYTGSLPQDAPPLEQELFLPKPFTLEQFMERIGRILAAGQGAAEYKEKAA